MATSKEGLLLWLFLLVAFAIASSDGLGCYVCGGSSATSCPASDDALTDAMKTDCPTAKACYKSVTRTSNPVSIRRCGNSEETAAKDCIEAHDGTNNIEICLCGDGQDYCNAATRTSDRWPILILTAALAKLIAS